MSTFRLHSLFNPTSVAVIGASQRPDSLGMPIMRNLISAGFHGAVLPVNPGYDSIHGVLSYKTVGEIPIVPDLAVLCTPPASIPALIGSLGQKGCRVVIIMTTEFGLHGARGTPLFAEILEGARKYGMRILGPSSTGIQVPRIGLNASWLNTPVQNGRLAFVSQSGSFTAAVMEWGHMNGIGFSHVISAGETVDIDFADILDYMATDSRTSAILLNFRGIGNPRKFLSAARAVARIKPVIVLKSGHSHEAGREGCGPGAPCVTEDEAYDAAIRRAGILRVYSTYELFDAVETLTYGQSMSGDRLAIVCNGISPGDMAADALLQGGGRLARLADGTIERVRKMYHRETERMNPLDLGRDADAARFREVVSILAEAQEVDSVLVMYTPTPVTKSDEIAAAISEIASRGGKKIIACWLGENRRDPRHDILTRCGIPVYVTPDEATRAFLHLIRFRKNQEMLMETPVIGPDEKITGRAEARQVLDVNLALGRECLNESDTARILRCYGLNTLETHTAATPDGAVAAAERIGYPVSLRLSSPVLDRTISVGNISFDLATGDAVRGAALGMDGIFSERYPDREHPGYVVQKMLRNPSAHLLSIGIVNDPLFGPLIRVGRGGAATGIPGDSSVTLPPLNMSLAGELISRANIGGVAWDRNGGPMDLGELKSALVRISRLLLDIPETVALSINPLMADEKGVVIIDARIEVRRGYKADEHLAIRPYPRELEEKALLPGGLPVFIRPIKPEDGPGYRRLLSRVSQKDLRMRFLSEIRDLPKSLLAQLIHIDYDREMALVAVREESVSEPEILGVVNISATNDRSVAEYSILVRTDVKGMGLGRLLMEKIIGYCRERGISSVFGLVHKSNSEMLRLTDRLQFRTIYHYDDDIIEVRRELK